jgi:dolichyl-phosphate-mannose--protein O-mannosyl transferase
MKGNMLFIWAMIVLMVTAAACGKSRKKYLDINKMKVVMWDVTQADEFASYYIRKDTTRNMQAATDSLYASVFALHGITALQFRQSFEHYRNNPGKYKVLLDSLTQYSNRIREERYRNLAAPQ